MERVSEWIQEQLRHLRRERDLAVLDVAGLPVEVEMEAADEAERRAPALDRVLARAADEWRRCIEEPASPRDQRGASRIDLYIRSSQGLRWPSAELGPDARPNAPYVRDKQFPWCGAFAAFCFAAAGLKPHLRKKVMPSTYRLMQWARGTERWVKPEDLRPGDLCIVGPADGKRWGAHITLVTKVGPTEIETIEGNAKGVGPDGKRYEGVIRQVRPFSASHPSRYRVMYGVRPLPEDFDPQEVR